jgi:hypothetical protein
MDRLPRRLRAVVAAALAGVSVSAAAACLLLAVAVAGWRSDRRRMTTEPDATTSAVDADAREAASLGIAA